MPARTAATTPAAGLDVIRTAIGRGFRFTPMVGVHAARLARRSEAPPHRFVVNGPTKVRLAPTCRVELAPGARLFAGFGGTMDVFNADRARGALVLEEGATLRLEGRAQLGFATKVLVREGATLTLGHRVRIGAGCLIVAEVDTSIGAETALSWGVTVMDSHMHEITTAERPRAQVTEPVRIGAGVLIGHDSLVLPGVTIGDGAVIGARSVVTRDVGPGELVVGSPARRIGTDAHWH